MALAARSTAFAGSVSLSRQPRRAAVSRGAAPPPRAGIFDFLQPKEAAPVSASLAYICIDCGCGLGPKRALSVPRHERSLLSPPSCRAASPAVLVVQPPARRWTARQHPPSARTAAAEPRRKLTCYSLARTAAAE